MFFPKATSWHAVHLCVECHKSLGNGAICYSSGVCPHCGHSSGSTICDTYTKVRRWVITKLVPWWNLFGVDDGHWEYKPEPTLDQRPTKPEPPKIVLLREDQDPQMGERRA
jgi:hypothetical protein